MDHCLQLHISLNDIFNTTPGFQTIALNSLAIGLVSEDLHHLILGKGVPKLQG